MKILVFGGKNLPDGSHTWYDRINSDGSYGGQIQAAIGHRVEAERVGKIVAYVDGGPELVPNASYYVETERARIVDEAAATTKK